MITLSRLAALFTLTAVFGMAGLILLAGAAFADDPAAVQIATALCSNDASLLTWVLRALGTVGGASILMNSKTLMKTPILGPVLSIVGANWSTWLREAAASAAAKQAAVICILVVMTAGLSACAGTPPAVATAPGAAVAAPDATAPPAAPTGPLAKLQAALQNLNNFTVTDLNAAEDIAVAKKDALAMPCFPALVTFVQGAPGSSPTMTVSGAFSAFELARTTRIQVVGNALNITIPDYLKLACSPLLLDEQNFVLKLAALAAGGAATAGAGPAGLAIIGSVLPIPLTLP